MSKRASYYIVFSSFSCVTCVVCTLLFRSVTHCSIAALKNLCLTSGFIYNRTNKEMKQEKKKKQTGKWIYFKGKDPDDRFHVRRHAVRVNGNYVRAPNLIEKVSETLNCFFLLPPSS